MNYELLQQVIVEQMPIQLPEDWVTRTIWSKFEPLQHNRQIIILKGMRRCGKSTFMHYVRSMHADSHYYLNFDDDRLVNFTIDDFQPLLELFIELYGTAKTVFFDEIQNILEWERFIRRLHDQDYKIYLTGSNAHLFSREMGTHLTGRYMALEIYPYSFKEYLAYHKIPIISKKIYTTQERGHFKKYFNDYCKIGGIPDYVRFKQAEYLNDLYESILYRDIIVRNRITKDHAIKVLVYYLASHVGKDVSFNNLKGLLKLASAATVSDYCHFLEASYLCYFINRYSPSLKVQAHYGKKSYFVDHALANRIGFRISKDQGRLLENIVFMELKRRGHAIYFHRDRKECDFILKVEHRVRQAIQVCAYLDNPETKQREFASLQEALHSYGLDTGLILTENAEYTKGNIYVMPVWKWLLAT